MKIHAIRLKEVGRFSAPVALEGLSGGLDVLAGPNELGKSTILKAVNAALFVPHTSKKQEIEELRPYAGGAPLIELDIETRGRPWRLRKQYLSSRSAELRDLTTGQLSRGADAETQLAALLGASGHFALLCVAQGAAMASMAPVRTGGATFMAAIESEVENIADGNVSRLVADRVRQELAGLHTSHNPPRPTGKLKKALDARDDLARRHADAERRLASAQERLDRLGTLRNELAQVADSELARSGEVLAAEARHAFDEAREARRKHAAAEQSVAACQQQLNSAKLALEIFDRDAATLEKLEAAARDALPMRAEVEERAAECANRLARARDARDAMKGALAALERSRRAIECAERLATAQAAHERRVAALDLLSENAAEEKIVEAARREASSIDKLEARLCAAAPRVTMRYSAGGAGKVTVEGRMLGDGEVLNPRRPLTLEIEGIGVLTIAPGQSGDDAHDAADLAARQEQLASLLQRAGATSLADAEQLLSRRRSLEADVAAATAQLKAAAPEGLERLQRSYDDLLAQVRSLGAPETATLDDLEARGAELGDGLAAAEKTLAEAMREERAARDALADLRAHHDARAQQIEQLIATLGAPEKRTDTRREKLAAFTAASEALNAAVREATAWRDSAPDNARLSDLKHTADLAETAHKRVRDELARLRNDVAGVEGELRSDRGGDVAALCAELGEQLAITDAHCCDLQEEAAALQLLAQELDAAGTRARDRFAKPVVQRLEPYLQLILPQARLVLGEDLAPEALERGSAREDFARLSGGTQEQLGLLVRLAFARLLADTGVPAPLIIDDAVVNTDDERLTRLFQALRHAAQSHQVLVLTCRQRDFEHLGGRRIALATWEDARAAA